MIPISKRAPTVGTLPPTIGNEFIDASLAEDVTTKLERRITDIRRADGTNGDFL